MSISKKLHIALVGLGFGSEFVPIYLDHPDVASVTICDLNPQRLQEVGDKFKIKQRFRDVNEVIHSSEIDAVHLISGIPDHAWQSVAVLNSGKHCACTVPMATSIKELQEIIAAQERSGKNYMMMETAVYTRQFLYAKALQEQGAFGRIQFLRGAHY
jgi:predicted dehydrogenase